MPRKSRPPCPPAPNNSHYVRRVVLPSGRAIEVVYFEPEPLPGRPAHGRRAISTSARTATRGLVYPVEWEEHDACTGRSRCAVRTASGMASDLYAQDVVDRFDEELDRGTEALVRDLKQLTRANMEDEIDRFVSGARRPTRSCPKTSRPLRRTRSTTPSATSSSAPLLPLGQRRQRGLRLRDHRQRLRARRLERAGGGDAVAQRLGLLGRA